MNQHQVKMLGFARLVLTTLERDKDWGPDTLEDIATAAHDYELADIDPETYQFRVIA